MKKIITYFFLAASLCYYGCSEDRIEGTGEGKLTGTVVIKTTNEPVENVKITTTPASTTVFTNADGEFVINSIENDEYSVKAELDGYLTAFEAATVLVGETSNVVIELQTSNENNRSPKEPQLLSPTDGATDVTTEAEFIWSSSKNDDDDLTYILELRNSASNDVETYEVVNDTTYAVNDLALGVKYFWQVSVNDGLNAEVRSSVSQFSTQAPPSNQYLFTRMINGNSVIYSGDFSLESNEGSEFKLTSESFNSFRPKRNLNTDKIAFLRTTGEGVHIYTMDLDGTNVKKITSNIPVNGFRIDQITFAWAESGAKIFYPNFDKLYSIDPDGGGVELIYKTADGSFISEVSTSDLNTNVIAVKTNDFEGYNARIFTVNLQTSAEQDVIFENMPGAVSGIDIQDNLDKVIYSYDVSGSENTIYRRFQSRIFIYDIATSSEEQLNTDVNAGDNDLFPQWSPTEGSIVFTRAGNNIGSTPSVYLIGLDDDFNNADKKLFNNASQPNWE